MNKQQRESYLKKYLEIFKNRNGIYHHGDELEIRFGTKKWEPITKSIFDNTIKYMKSIGFNTNKDGEDGQSYTINNIWPTNLGEIALSWETDGIEEYSVEWCFDTWSSN